MKSNIFLCEIILYNTLISYFINMKSYFIFAIFLTIAYIIYYVVIITQELYGKKKDGKPEEEVFNIDSDEEEEESISVTESSLQNCVHPVQRAQEPVMYIIPMLFLTVWDLPI